MKFPRTTSGSGSRQWCTSVERANDSDNALLSQLSHQTVFVDHSHEKEL